jgi:hypothetical protein
MPKVPESQGNQLFYKTGGLFAAAGRQICHTKGNGSGVRQSM